MLAARRPPWRSPPDQPRWARPALLAIAAAGAVLYAWNIAHAGFAPFYAVAVRSMSEHLRAFVYGGFDPRATITIEKLPGAFLVQAVSARIFGFHAWSLALPQVIEGVVSILFMYRVVRRWAGAGAGLLAAGIFTATPIAASVFGHAMEDGALVMCLLAAADCGQRAADEARPRALLGAAVWVGVAFGVKMLEAWLIVPALALAYLVGAGDAGGQAGGSVIGPEGSSPAARRSVARRRRLLELGAAGVVMLAVSLAWLTPYVFTASADRPYVDGSTNDSAAAMVFGYNGLGRFGVTLPGAASPVRAGIPGANGWAKLFDARLAPEVGWLYPLVLLGLVAGIACRRRRDRGTLPSAAGFVMWTVWLLTFGLSFSAVGALPHTAYLVVLAPPIAALSSVGVVLAWRWRRERAWRDLLALAVAAELAWAAVVWHDHRHFLPAVFVAAAMLGALGVVALAVVSMSSRVDARVLVIGAVAAVAAALVPPVAWSASVLDVRYAGQAVDASAGPAGSYGVVTGLDFGVVPPGLEWIYRYLAAHRDGAPYLMAAQSWYVAAPYILQTGGEILPMGGYTGEIPAPSPARLHGLVRSGRLRFVMLSPEAGTAGPTGANPGGLGREQRAIAGWVRRSCTQASLGRSGSLGLFRIFVGPLYRCVPVRR